jgi:MFS superfamily sulfate permease-like transporter
MSLIELGQIKNYELYSSKHKYSTSEEPNNIKIVKLTQPLYFINADDFRKHLNKLCPLKEVVQLKSICENVSWLKKGAYLKLNLNPR